MENCPNCGAPVSGKVCDYCGTRHAKESESVTITVTNEYTSIFDWGGNEVYRVLAGNEAYRVAETNVQGLRLDR